MDQYLVAMGCVVAVLALFVAYIFFSDRKDRRRYEPTEHGRTPL